MVPKPSSPPTTNSCSSTTWMPKLLRQLNMEGTLHHLLVFGLKASAVQRRATAPRPLRQDVIGKIRVHSVQEHSLLAATHYVHEAGQDGGTVMRERGAGAQIGPEVGPDVVQLKAAGLGGAALPSGDQQIHGGQAGAAHRAAGGTTVFELFAVEIYNRQLMLGEVQELLRDGDHLLEVVQNVHEHPVPEFRTVVEVDKLPDADAVPQTYPVLQEEAAGLNHPGDQELVGRLQNVHHVIFCHDNSVGVGEVDDEVHHLRQHPGDSAPVKSVLRDQDFEP
ncbi:unnamed protein product [Menidia menidia]|uniref:(Atlantic silverside) hypothetical protein n=1 Tax=Menidia menidia TaxID=238744 RepID=A0A8S4BGE6_9TELE|nr:unnamed protein product [Menidia menidia]